MERHAVPNCEIDGGEEADYEREVDGGGAELDSVGDPAVGQRCYDGNGVCDCWVSVDLWNRINFEGFEPEVHVASYVLAADEECIVSCIDPEMPFAEDTLDSMPGEDYFFSFAFVSHAF